MRKKSLSVKKIIHNKNLLKISDKKIINIYQRFKKNIVMASAINIIEIWDKDNYEKSINDKNIDFVKLTEQVMGNQNNELS